MIQAKPITHSSVQKKESMNRHFHSMEMGFYSMRLVNKKVFSRFLQNSHVGFTVASYALAPAIIF